MYIDRIVELGLEGLIVKIGHLSIALDSANAGEMDEAAKAAVLRSYRIALRELGAEWVAAHQPDQLKRRPRRVFASALDNNVYHEAVAGEVLAAVRGELAGMALREKLGKLPSGTLLH